MKIVYLSAGPGIDLAEHRNRGGAIHVRALVCALADLGHEVLLDTWRHNAAHVVSWVEPLVTARYRPKADLPDRFEEGSLQ
jgi:hypothetical protein